MPKKTPHHSTTGQTVMMLFCVVALIGLTMLLGPTGQPPIMSNHIKGTVGERMDAILNPEFQPEIYDENDDIQEDSRNL